MLLFQFLEMLVSSLLRFYLPANRWWEYLFLYTVTDTGVADIVVCLIILKVFVHFSLVYRIPTCPGQDEESWLAYTGNFNFLFFCHLLDLWLLFKRRCLLESPKEGFLLSSSGIKMWSLDLKQSCCYCMLTSLRIKIQQLGDSTERIRKYGGSGWHCWTIILIIDLLIRFL